LRRLSPPDSGYSGHASGRKAKGRPRLFAEHRNADALRKSKKRRAGLLIITKNPQRPLFHKRALVFGNIR